MNRQALEYLEGKGGSCDWQDMTLDMSERMLDANICGLVDSDHDSETWSINQSGKEYLENLKEK